MAGRVLLRSVLLGAAAGARSMTPLAVLAARRPGWMRLVAGGAALGELAFDKVPQAPSRLKPAPLAGRMVLGAIAGGAYARRHGMRPALPALAAGAAAIATSYGGAQWRAYASRHSLALPAAIAEDAAAFALSWASARP